MTASEKSSLFTFTGATGTVDSADNVSLVDDGCDPAAPEEWTYKILRVDGDDAGDEINASVEFTLIEEVPSGDTLIAQPKLISPGKYTLHMGFQSKNHPLVNIYVNGKTIATDLDVAPSTPWNYDRVNSTCPGTKWDGIGGMVGVIEIEGTSPQEVKLKVEFAANQEGQTGEILKIYHWALIPDYTYLWSTAEKTDSISIAPNAETIDYWVKVSNGSESIYDTLTIEGCPDLEPEPTVLDNKNLQGFEIYPVPSYGVLNVQVPTDSSIELNVLDVNGKLFIKKELTQASNQIDIQNLKGGLYILILKDESGVIHQQKLIKR